MHIFPFLCNFALENLAEIPSNYDRKIAIPYKAGTIPSSVVQLHWHEPWVGSAVKPNRLVVFTFKLPISAYAPGCVPKVEIKERLIIIFQTIDIQDLLSLRGLKQEFKLGEKYINHIIEEAQRTLADYTQLLQKIINSKIANEE